MTSSDASTPPNESPNESPNPPAPSHNLSAPEFEAVIRRAVELQTGSSARIEEGVSESEVVRIGQELGLDPTTVRRAIAEVRIRPAEERGSLTALVGPRAVRASRLVRRPAAGTGSEVVRYLRETEFMVMQRRFPNRVRYVRDSSLAAGLGRFARGFSRGKQPLNLKQIDVAISALDAESCLVEISSDLGDVRAGVAAGVLGSGSALAGVGAAFVWATPIADPFMLLAAPIVAGSWYGMRAIYRHVAKSLQDKLEALLDRVEHNDLA
jgi:hypothetical protein